mmetsp:Transcript_66808/g.159878  ORF Transcript_66808/g.159878 Transcript_66808/m.159878 type:complete len:518 (+) Transcript_66808:78-1631(+)
MFAPAPPSGTSGLVGSSFAQTTNLHHAADFGRVPGSGVPASPLRVAALSRLRQSDFAPRFERGILPSALPRTSTPPWLAPVPPAVLHEALPRHLSRTRQDERVDVLPLRPRPSPNSGTWDDELMAAARARRRSGACRGSSNEARWERDRSPGAAAAQGSDEPENLKRQVARLAQQRRATRDERFVEQLTVASRKQVVTEQRRHEMEVAELHEEYRQKFARLQRGVEDIHSQLLQQVSKLEAGAEAQAGQSSAAGGVGEMMKDRPWNSTQEPVPTGGFGMPSVDSVESALEALRTSQARLVAMASDAMEKSTEASTARHAAEEAERLGRERAEVESSGAVQLRGRLKEQAYATATSHAHHAQYHAFRAWVSAMKNAAKEAQHNKQIFDLQAKSWTDADALRKDLEKDIGRLRRQRRSHGVSAIHANLAFQMHAVLTVWAHLVTEAQREVAHQRQLDFAAAEAAADCVALRAECHCRVAELRRRQCAVLLTGIRAHADHWRHAIMCAWAAIASASRLEV